MSQLTVATFNLYLGADLQPLFGAPTPEELAVRAVAVWQQVMDGEPSARMRAAAGIVVQDLPDVLAVQEAVRWTVTDPNGGMVTELDQLALLLAALRDLGHPYRVVSRTQSFSSDGLPVRVPGLGAVKLADTGALLVRDDRAVEVTASASGRYVAAMALPVLGGTLPLVRGWCSADLTQGGRPVRVVATHLEAYDASVRVAQVRELLDGGALDGGALDGGALGGGALGGGTTDGGELPVVVLGDLNCQAPAERGSGGHASQGAEADAYEMLQQRGFRDCWLAAERRFGNAAGATCRPESGLDDPGCRFDHRIDLVFASSSLGVAAARVLGDDPADRTPAGRWPSDHACLVVRLDLD